MHKIWACEQRLCLLRKIVIVGLVEEEVGGKLLVLVACEVSLNSLFAAKSQTAKLQI